MPTQPTQTASERIVNHTQAFNVGRESTDPVRVQHYCMSAMNIWTLMAAAANIPEDDDDGRLIQPGTSPTQLRCKIGVHWGRPNVRIVSGSRGCGHVGRAAERVAVHFNEVAFYLMDAFLISSVPHNWGMSVIT
jgi:hypothetical protein